MNYIERMKIELEELNERISKLSKFIDDGNAAKLSDEDCSLLLIQYNAMITYSNVLLLRYNKATKE